MDRLDEGEMFDARKKLKLLRSLVPVYVRYLVPSKIIPDLFPILGEEKRNQIVETERNSREKAVQILMHAVLEKKEEGLNHFISALRVQDGNEFAGFLNQLDNADMASADSAGNQQASDYFAFIFRCLEGEVIRSLSKLELNATAQNLYSEGAIDEEDRVKIEGMARHDGAVHLFTVLPGDPLWPMKLFCALEEVKSELVRKIDPCGETPVLSKEAMGHKLEASGPSECFSSDLDGGETEPKRLYYSEEQQSMDDTLDLTQGGLDGEMLDVDGSILDEDWSDDEEKDDAGMEKSLHVLHPLRGYQTELAEAACKGTNTIICAPTGSGKTRVATHIIQKHLDDAQSGVRRKVVFLARTGPLVSQQFKVLEAGLPSFTVIQISGQTSYHDNAHFLVEEYDVLVMTPKILENHLGPDMIPSLAIFSLIIFDECHHTRKGEPYNSVMKAYFKSKGEGEKNLPQIVGLTASIGVEKASTVLKAENSIIELMANMDVKHITQVKDPANLLELESTVPTPDEYTKTLRPRGKDIVSQCIQDVMAQIEELLDHEFPTPLEDLELKKVKSSQQEQPMDRTSQKYGQWARNVCKKANLVHIPESSDKNFTAEVIEMRRLFSQNVRLLAETLVIFNEALDVHELSRPEDVLDHLKKNLDPRHPTNSPERSQLEEKLCFLFAGLQRHLKQAKTPANPNLETLANVIEENLDGKWETSRVMVFVRTRTTCMALCRWLNSQAVSQQLQQLKAKPFTGAGARQELGGMTQAEQDDAVAKFRAGDVRLLVCTSVGQEGMDIPDCNLVIRYNHVSNEVATVQIRGRCRKAGGISMLLAMRLVIQKEVINRRLVKIMNEAIENVIKKRSKEVTNLILKAQQIATKANLKSKTPQKPKKSPDSFILECSGCRKVHVPGARIRTIKGCHHVIIGSEPQNNDEVRVIDKSEPVFVDDNVEFYGNIICKKCPATRQKVLGSVSRYEGVYFHTIKAQSWTVLNTENNRPVKAGKWKWTEVDEMYEILELTRRDIRSHLGESLSSDEED